MACDWLVIDDPRAVTALLEPDFVILLKPFMAAPCTVHEAAAWLGMDPRALYYPVRRMLAFGLLELAFESPRRGRALKHYRASAKTFFVPFRASPHASVQDFISKGQEAWSQRLMRSVAKEATEAEGAAQLCLQIGYQDGFIMHGLALDPRLETPPLPPGRAVSVWDSSLYLSEDDARRLAEELQAVLGRYRDKRSGRRRLVHLAVAPWED